MDADGPSLRTLVDGCLERGDPLGARGHLDELWQASASPALAGFVLSRFERIAPAWPLVPLRVSILRSFTIEPLVPLLRAGAAIGGLDLTVHLGGFNAYAQEILDPASSLYRSKPDLVFLAAQTRDVAPALWRDFADLSAADADRAVEAVTEDFGLWIQTLRERTNATLVIHNLEVPPWPSQGVADDRLERSQVAAIRSINSRLVELARETPGVHVLDWDGLVARHGRLGSHDARRWLTVRMPFPAEKLNAFAEEWLRYAHPVSGRVAKCLVCDLDGTLWGGVLGEDGPDGIELGVEYPGAAYVELQRALLDLHRRGIILAVCSKNDEDEALQILAEHPHMLLRLPHIATHRIGWTDKAEGLREIAAELNIGLDSLAFVDDSPVECANVRRRLPEVRVLRLSGDPVGYAELLRRQPYFERLTLSDEDRRRGQLDASRRKWLELERSATRIEDFYHSLRMKVELDELTAGTLARAAQLTQKTSQFNTTTRRYSEQELAALAADGAHRVMTARVTDRFGDSGIVGIAIVSVRGEVWELDSFLLSCRVIGRAVETAMLATLAEQARAAGARYVRGEFVSTAKNAPAAAAYARHGFSRLREEAGVSLWQLDLAVCSIAAPPWIERTEPVSR